MDAVKKRQTTAALAMLLFVLLALVIGFPKSRTGSRPSEGRPEPFKKPEGGFQDKLSEEAKSLDTYLKTLKAEEERVSPSLEESDTSEGER